MQRAQLLRTERRASASEWVHKGLEEAHRKEVGEALRIRCQAMQAIHLHLVCAQRGVKALRTPQAALARPPAASLARAACGALRKKSVNRGYHYQHRAKMVGVCVAPRVPGRVDAGISGSRASTERTRATHISGHRRDGQYKGQPAEHGVHATL